MWAETDFRVVIGNTSIDYDGTKEEINRRKHGYSLESAAYLLRRLVLPIPSPFFITTDPFEENGEIRHNHMTLDDEGNIVFFATTMYPAKRFASSLFVGQVLMNGGSTSNRPPSYFPSRRPTQLSMGRRKAAPLTLSV